jgi:hypothetical protein
MEGGLINPLALIRTGAAKGVTSMPAADQFTGTCHWQLRRSARLPTAWAESSACTISKP